MHPDHPHTRKKRSQALARTRGITMRASSHPIEPLNAPEVHTGKQIEKNTFFKARRVARRRHSKKLKKKERKATLTPLV
jgi:hypothetical protein